MRVLTLLVGAVVFAAMLIMDPVALGRLGYACATGGCGVRPRWLVAGVAVLVVAWAVRAGLRHWRRPPPPVGRGKPARAKPARPKRGQGRPQAKPAANPRRTTRRKPRPVG